MPIPRRLLSEGEEVVVDVRPHWLFAAGPFMLTVVAGAGAIAVLVAFPNAPVGVGYALAAMVGIPAMWLVVRIVRWRSISLVITNQRVIYRRGVLGRDLIQLRLPRVTEVHCSQSLGNRLLGAGRLIVEVDGDDPLVVDHVRRPRVLQRVINDQLGRPFDAIPDSGGSDGAREAEFHQWSPLDPTPPHGTALVPAPGNPVGVSIHEQLIQLDDLRRRGIVSEGEFEAKKSELLSRL